MDQISHANSNSYNYHTDPLFKGSGLLKLSDQYIHDVAVFVHNFKYGKLPKSFDSLTYFVQINQPHNLKINHAYCPPYRTICTSLVPLHRLPMIDIDIDIDIDIYFSNPQIINIINIHISLYMIVNEVEMRGAA